MRIALTPLLACFALVGCATPSAPTLDGSNRQAINDTNTVRLLQRGFSAQPTEAQGTGTGEMSRVFRYHFPAGGSTLSLSAREMGELIPLARLAKNIEVRARTDADRSSEADLTTAKRRGEAARRMLIQNGITPSKIKVNYLSGGDYIDNNGTPEGRALNRRVEIEVIGQQT